MKMDRKQKRRVAQRTLCKLLNGMGIGSSKLGFFVRLIVGATGEAGRGGYTLRREEKSA
jgi:hypothetical protein